MFPTPRYNTLDPELTHSPSRRLGAQPVQSHPTATPWPRGSPPGTCARPWSAPAAGKSHHRGRSLRPLASQLGLPTPTAPDTAASAVVTHCEGGGLRQTCWASSCPAASQCPRRGGTWVGHNGTSPSHQRLPSPALLLLVPGAELLRLAVREAVRVTATHMCIQTPHPLRGQWKNTPKQTLVSPPPPPNVQSAASID